MAKMNKTYTQKIRGWGTILDYQDKVPTKYAGKSFFEAWHDEIDDFKKMTDEEKWEMGYWAERQAYKSAGRTMFIYGIVVGAIVVFVLATLFLK